MKILDSTEMIYTDDFYYDLFDGGYIVPDEILVEEDAKKVYEAIKTIDEFYDTLRLNGLFGEC